MPRFYWQSINKKSFVKDTLLLFHCPLSVRMKSARDCFKDPIREANMPRRSCPCRGVPTSCRGSAPAQLHILHTEAISLLKVCQLCLGKGRMVPWGGCYHENNIFDEILHEFLRIPFLRIPFLRNNKIRFSKRCLIWIKPQTDIPTV